MAPVPRRTPWASTAEFFHIFSLLFVSEGNTASQQFGINRVKVWIERGDCPHAIESTMCLLEIVLRDTTTVASTSAFLRPSAQELRLAYSMALIRFVNSQIDPLQTTYYAKSMAALANQLGLPLWFIELRHAATHEDLPALSVLREAAKQALDWLYLNYWLPTSNPNSLSHQLSLQALSSLQGLFSTYKTLTKTCLRDASKVSSTKGDMIKVYKGIDRWIMEAQGGGRGKENALAAVVDALLEPGGLVPTARKKRASTRAPVLSCELAALWTPLLSRLEEAHEGFIEGLLLRMIDILGTSEEPTLPPMQNTLDRSYALTLIAWTVHFLSLSDDDSLAEQIIKSCLLSSTPNTLALIEAMTKSDAALADIVGPLLHVLRNADTGLVLPISNDEAKTGLELMEARMMDLEARLSATGPHAPAAIRARKEAIQLVSQGWQLVDEAKWTPCPIGAFVHQGSGTMSSAEKLVALDLVW